LPPAVKTKNAARLPVERCTSLPQNIRIAVFFDRFHYFILFCGCCQSLLHGKFPHCPFPPRGSAAKAVPRCDSAGFVKAARILGKMTTASLYSKY
jgi:hypothetical protein